MKIYLTFIRNGPRGPLYSVSTEDGEALKTSTTTPLSHGCKALLDRGIDPTTEIELWSRDESHPRMRTKAAYGQRLSYEGPNGFSRVKWRDLPEHFLVG
jgi:hypothetical protein